LDHRPALAPVLRREAAALQPRGHGLLPDAGDGLGRQAPVVLLGLLLERHQHVLHEFTRPRLELELLRRELVDGRGGGQRCGHAEPPSRLRSPAVRSAALPGSPRRRLWWLAITSIASSRARTTAGSVSCSVAS